MCINVYKQTTYLHSKAWCPKFVTGLNVRFRIISCPFFPTTAWRWCNKVFFKSLWFFCLLELQINNYEIVKTIFHISHDIQKLSKGLPEFPNFVQLMNLQNNSWKFAQSISKRITCKESQTCIKKSFWNPST